MPELTQVEKIPTIYEERTEVGSDCPKESMTERVRRLRAEAQDQKEFIKKFHEVIFCATALQVLLLVLFIVLPISELVIGAMYSNDCTVKEFLPTFNIIAGVIGVFLGLAALFVVLKDKCDDYWDDEEDDQERLISMKPRWIRMLALVVYGGCVIFWLIIGSIMVYGVYDDVVYDDTSSPNYCNQVLYLFTFGLVTAGYVLMLLAIIYFVITVVITCNMRFQQKPEASDTHV